MDTNNTFNSGTEDKQTTAQEEQSFTSNENTDKENHDGGSDLTVLEKRLRDKDDYIKQLEKEARELRESIADSAYDKEKSKAIDEVMEEIKQLKEASSSSRTELDTKELAAKVKEELKAEQTEAQRQQNFQEVAAKLTSTYGGEKVDAKVREAAEANGLTFDDIFELARKSPKSVYKLMGVDTVQPQGSSFTKSSVNTQTLTENTNKRDLSYFSQLRRENPTEYWKPEVQREFRKLFLKDK